MSRRPHLVPKVLLPVVVAFVAASFSTAPASSQPHGGEAKITGSFQSPKGAWPSQAALLWHDQPDNRVAHFCGGTVVSANWVLTSARCWLDGWGVAIKPLTVDVLVGSQSLKTGGRRIRAKSVLVHPRFDRRTLDYDVALVRLAKPTAAKPQAISSVPVPPHAKAVMAGWGTADRNDPADPLFRPTELRQASFWVGTDSLCRTGSMPYRGATMLCLYGLNREMLEDDRGDPVLVQRSGAWVQVGVASWRGVASDRFHTSFVARLAPAAPWIRQVLRG